MGEKKKVLIVDDEGLNAMALGEHLTKMGYLIVGFAATGIEAIQKAKDEKPDIIFLDIRLPGSMDGLEAVNIIHRHGKIPTIIISGYTEKIMIERDSAFQPIAFLSKPFNFDEIDGILDRLFKDEKN
jgi:CheY-like chemotaxis protein